MKKNDRIALHAKSVAELQAELAVLEKEYAIARIKKQAGKLKNTHIALQADAIARIKTIIGEKNASA